MTGDLDATDVDNAADTLKAVATAAASIGGYGTYTVDRRGTLELHARQFQPDRAGAERRPSTTDTFSVITADGTAQPVTITINGTNDAAVISGDT